MGIEERYQPARPRCARALALADEHVATHLSGVLECVVEIAEHRLQNSMRLR